MSTHIAIYKHGLILLLLIIFSACRAGDPYRMSPGQLQELKTAYQSLEDSYRLLRQEYKSSRDALPSELRKIYAQISDMRQQMRLNHRQLITLQSDRRKPPNKMRIKRMDMQLQLQNHRVGEWYRQLGSFHRQLATFHLRHAQPKLGKLNRRLSQSYTGMRSMIPGLNEPADIPYNIKANPSFLSGAYLYGQNCASCHGNNARGRAGIFPPLVDSQWITGNTTVPIRILLHGLSGTIKVRGQKYSGRMPSFKARLSAAEMVAILNFLRAQSKDKLPQITLDEVIRLGKKYSRRVQPWRASQLQDN